MEFDYVRPQNSNELKYIYDILNTKLPFKLDIPISIDGFNPNISFIKNL
jgi:hypothetical protein